MGVSESAHQSNYLECGEGGGAGPGILVFCPNQLSARAMVC